MKDCSPTIVSTLWTQQNKPEPKQQQQQQQHVSCLVFSLSRWCLSPLPQWLVGSCRVPSFQSKICNLVSYLPPTESPMSHALLTSIYDLVTHLSCWGDPIPLLFSIHKSFPSLSPASSLNGGEVTMPTIPSKSMLKVKGRNKASDCTSDYPTSFTFYYLFIYLHFLCSWWYFGIY